MIRISTFNIQNDFSKYTIEKTKKIYDYMIDNDIDILGLQEVYSKLYNDLNSLINKKYEIIGTYRFLSKIILNRFNEMLPVITKYRIINHKTYHLPHFPSPTKRIITRVLIGYKGSYISIYNTHLDYKFNMVKERELKKIYKIISKDDNPIVLIGDFNLKNNNKTFTDFEKKLQDLNMYRVNLDEKTFKPSKYKREIDHIFLSKNFVVKNKEVVKNLDISDHYPVLIDVDINTKG